MRVEDQIVYKTVDRLPLELTLFQPVPAKFARSPLVVYIHGGGWSNGSRFVAGKQNLLPVIRRLNENGIAVASIDYRLAGRGGSTALDAAADCRDAVSFLVSQAEKFHLDPGRIGIFGSSAGGHLALVTALGKQGDYPSDPALSVHRGKILCVAAYYPLVSMVDPAMWKDSNFERPQRFEPLLGGRWEEKKDIAGKLSPTLLLQPDSPSIFLAHGDQDRVLNVVNSRTLAALAEERKVPVECLIVKGGGHGFRGQIDPAMEVIHQRTADFFLRYLLPAEAGK